MTLTMRVPPFSSGSFSEAAGSSGLPTSLRAGGMLRTCCGTSRTISTTPRARAKFEYSAAPRDAAAWFAWLSMGFPGE